MKKVLSIIISAIMLVSTGVVTFSAFAANSPIATVIPDVEVDSRPTNDVDIIFDKDVHNKITITYKGNREVIRWENNLDKLGLTLNTDYIIIYNSAARSATNTNAKSITILLNTVKAVDTWNTQKVYFNVITKGGYPDPNVGMTGNDKNDVTWEVNPDNPNELIFHYKGDGNVSDWKTNLDALGLKEGVDYILKKNSDGTFSIEFLSQAAVNAWNNGKVKIEATVDKNNTTTPPTVQRPNINTSPTSPNTGIGLAGISGVSAIGAGIIILAAKKKKSSD